MSSDATPIATAAVQRQTYWCHECDMSVSLISSSSSATLPLCPYCRSDFLEQMDNNNNNISNPNSSIHTSIHPNPITLDPMFPQFLTTPQTLTNHHTDTTTATIFPYTTSAGAATADDNFLLDSSYLHRLINQMTAGEATGPSVPCHQNPTSKSAIEAIPSIKITEMMIELDSVIMCAVCKDQFVVDNEAKQLPCNHIYHQDCILPWLKTHNSCPVCRFKMPSESGGIKVRRRRERFGNARFGDYIGDDEFYGFGSTLRHIARRHRLVFPVSRRENGVEVVEGDAEEETMLMSPTQVAEAEMGALERENSVETVSSGWPSWPIDGEGGDQEVGASGRGNDGTGAVL